MRNVSSYPAADVLMLSNPSATDLFNSPNASRMALDSSVNDFIWFVLRSKLESNSWFNSRPDSIQLDIWVCKLVTRLSTSFVVPSILAKTSSRVDVNLSAEVSTFCHAGDSTIFCKPPTVFSNLCDMLATFLVASSAVFTNASFCTDNFSCKSFAVAICCFNVSWIA